MFCFHRPLRRNDTNKSENDMQHKQLVSSSSDNINTLSLPVMTTLNTCLSDSNVSQCETKKNHKWKSRIKFDTGKNYIGLRLKVFQSSENITQDDKDFENVSVASVSSHEITKDQIEYIDVIESSHHSLTESQDCCQTSSHTSKSIKTEICDNISVQNNSVKELTQDIRTKDASEEIKQLRSRKVVSPFNSICSLFNNVKKQQINVLLNKNNSCVDVRNNQDIVCCPVLSNPTLDEPNMVNNEQLNSEIIVSESPKTNIEYLSNLHINNQSESSPFINSESSSNEGTSSDDIAPMASPESLTPVDSVVSSPIIQISNHDCLDSELSVSSYTDSMSINLNCDIGKTKCKLLHEGDINVCYINHTRKVINKVLSSKFLRRWELHHVYLNDYCISSKTPTGFLEMTVPYSNLEDAFVVGRMDQDERYCISITLPTGSLLFQACSPAVRNQWLHSLQWKKNIYKYRNILQRPTRTEVVLKEIKSLIHMTLTSPLQDESIYSVPIEIVSKLLNKEHLWQDRTKREDLITLISPLLDDTQPSPEMCEFLSHHCQLHPRSPVVADVLTPIVHRILKRNVDFGKSLLMRRFVADYIKALHEQNDGEDAVRKFVASAHGPNYGCPHPRVLHNLVAVCLAATFSHFERRRAVVLNGTRNETHQLDIVNDLDRELCCYLTTFNVMSEYDDWRPSLAQLLQPIPFPDDALSNELFIKKLTPVLQRIGTDVRCNVHQMILGIRDSKEGWLQVYCPSSLACHDEGALWCQMLETLFACCCKRKSFLQKLVKQLGAVLLVALRDHTVAQDALCLMLEWRLLNGEEQDMQVATTLQSTENGREKYKELCKKQEHLRELQKKGGPRKLTLPSRSTDADVACLLSCGSFGNLECLSLAFTHVTSACAPLLIQLPSLLYLNLWATQFGDAGLIMIAEHLDKLQVLNLCETPVSDKGIAALTAMTNLRKLNLNSTKLSLQTMETLKHKLPSLQELDIRYTDAW